MPLLIKVDKTIAKEQNVNFEAQLFKAADKLKDEFSTPEDRDEYKAENIFFVPEKVFFRL